MYLSFLKGRLRRIIDRIQLGPKVYKLSLIASRLCSDTVALDCGASYFPHPQWGCVRQNSSCTWISFDPNGENLDYLNHWGVKHNARLIRNNIGLAGESGAKILYKTHIDSGSSILKPRLCDDWNHRLDSGYFFPLSEVLIDCMSLNDFFHQTDVLHNAAPLWVKLDTQGSELEILRGIGETHSRTSLVLVEAECTLQRTPVMTNSGKIAELIGYMESLNMELIRLTPYPVPSGNKKSRPSLNGTYVASECDAVFAISPTYCLQRRPLEHNLSLVSAYISYGLYYEACSHSRKILSASKFKLRSEQISLLDMVVSLSGVL